MPDKPNWQELTPGTEQRSPTENYDNRYGRYKDAANEKSSKEPPAQPKPFNIRSA